MLSYETMISRTKRAVKQNMNNIGFSINDIHNLIDVGIIQKLSNGDNKTIINTLFDNPEICSLHKTLSLIRKPVYGLHILCTELIARLRHMESLGYDDNIASLTILIGRLITINRDIYNSISYSDRNFLQITFRLISVRYTIINSFYGSGMNSQRNSQPNYQV